MVICEWCVESQREAVARLPTPRGEIPVCASHKQWALEHCWYVETLDGKPLGDEAFVARVNKKHMALRGSLDLKFQTRRRVHTGGV